MINFYLCFLVLIALIIYGGYEGTINLFIYGELRIKYYITLRKLHHWRNKFAKDIGKDTINFNDFVKEYEANQKY